jgi:hypothetical protein
MKARDGQGGGSRCQPRLAPRSRQRRRSGGRNRRPQGRSSWAKLCHSNSAISESGQITQASWPKSAVSSVGFLPRCTYNPIRFFCLESEMDITEEQMPPAQRPPMPEKGVPPKDRPDTGPSPDLINPEEPERKASRQTLCRTWTLTGRTRLRVKSSTEYANCGLPQAGELCPRARMRVNKSQIRAVTVAGR